MRTQCLNFLFGTLKYSHTKDYYRVLGVSKSASGKEIKLAYIKLAKKHHPDMNKGKESEIFKDINQANGVLSDEKTKQEYDNAYKASTESPKPQKASNHNHHHNYTYYQNYSNQANHESRQESYKTYEYPNGFAEWFRSERREKYKNPKQSGPVQKQEYKEGMFSSQSRYEQKLKMHYEMGRAHESQERQKELHNSPTLQQELERLKGSLSNKFKSYSNSFSWGNKQSR